MNPHPVVKDFDVVQQSVLRLPSGREALVVNHLTLQVAEETFRHRLVPTVAFAAHALRAAPRPRAFL